MMATAMSGSFTAGLAERCAILRELWTLAETPENWTIYRRPDRTDPTFLELCASIRKSGINTPLEVSSDGYIISGHRRFIAAQACGLFEVPCFIDPTVVMGNLNREERIALLIERNRGTRIKSDSELYLEAAAMHPRVAVLALRSGGEESEQLARAIATAPVDPAHKTFSSVRRMAWATSRRNASRCKYSLRGWASALL